MPTTKTTTSGDVPRTTSVEQGDEDDRQGEERLDDAAQDVVDGAPVVAHDEPEQRPGDDTEHGRQRRDDQDVARSDHHPRQDVAPEPVGAHPVLGAGRQVAGGEAS